LNPWIAGAIGLAVGAAVAWFLCEARWKKKENLRAHLLSFAAHEINTPVSALNMTVMNLLSGLFGEVSEEQKPWVRLMREQVSRLERLVGDLRDVMHLEFHRDIHMSPEPVDLTALVRKEIDCMKEALQRAEAEIEDTLPEDLPAAKVDPDRASRIFAAGLAHVRKFRSEGKVTIKGASESGRVSVMISWTGRETDDSELEQMLGLFYPAERAHSQIQSVSGFGLGLANSLTLANGGTMTLESDDGSRFTLTTEFPQHAGGR